MQLPRDFDAADLGQGLCAGGGIKHFKARFELFLRVANKFDNLDPTVQNNLDRTFRRIDGLRRFDPEPWRAKSYGSRFRDEMRELQQAYDRGEHFALAERVTKWSSVIGSPPDDVRA